MTQPVCLVIGAGAGIGGHVAKRFAREGFHACLARRSDSQGLARLVTEITHAGGAASVFTLNAIEENSIEALIENIESRIGAIDVAVYKLRAQIGDRALAEASLKIFEMGGRRLPCRTLNAEFAAKGVHIAHIVIDGAVDAPDTLGEMLGPAPYQALRAHKGLDKDGLLPPTEIANPYYHLASQHRSAWTFEIDRRAYSDLAWWNHTGLAL